MVEDHTRIPALDSGIVKCDYDPVISRLVFSRGVFRLIGTILSLVALFMGTGGVIMIIRNISPPRITILGAIPFFWIAYWAILHTSLLWIATSDCCLAQDRVRIDFGMFLSLRFPVSAIHNGNITRLTPANRLEQQLFGQEMYVIGVKSLTPLHRLISLYFRLGHYPSFIVSSQHNNHQLFIQSLTEPLRDVSEKTG